MRHADTCIGWRSAWAGCLALLLAWLPLSTAQAAKLYRWVDENGQVHYTDRLPPQQAGKSRVELDERGQMLERVGRAKTAEEVAEEQERARWQAEQERLLEEQQKADLALLRTFRSEEDIALTRDGKIQAVEVQVTVLQGNIKRLKEGLTKYQEEAANLERAGKAVHENLLQSIATAREQIEDQYGAIARKEGLKITIYEQAARDLKRFRELKRIQAEENPEQLARSQRQQNPPYIYRCRDPERCAAAWARVPTFVSARATTPIQLDGERIVMTRAPRADTDISLAVSRIGRPDDPDGVVLFLDVQCRNTPQGEALCEGAEVRRTLEEFQTAVGG